MLRLTAPVWMANPTFARILADYEVQYPDVRLDVNLSGRLVNLVEEGFDPALRATLTRSAWTIRLAVIDGGNGCRLAVKSHQEQLQAARLTSLRRRLDVSTRTHPRTPTLLDQGRFGSASQKCRQTVHRGPMSPRRRGRQGSRRRHSRS
jgi:DNA-binding transcriptional LysR family regulator